VRGVTPREEDDANLMAYGPLIPLSTYIALLGFSELFRHRPACCNAQLPAHGAGRQMDRHTDSPFQIGTSKIKNLFSDNPKAKESAV